MDGYVEVAIFVYIHMYTSVCIYLYMSPYRYVFQISTKCWETFRANVCAYVRRDFVHILAFGCYCVFCTLFVGFLCVFLRFFDICFCVFSSRL